MSQVRQFVSRRADVPRGHLFYSHGCVVVLFLAEEHRCGGRTRRCMERDVAYHHCTLTLGNGGGCLWNEGWPPERSALQLKDPPMMTNYNSKSKCTCTGDEAEASRVAKAKKQATRKKEQKKWRKKEKEKRLAEDDEPLL